MATYNFTVRAEDETGAFADRAFSIQVRNNLVDRLLTINGTNAYSSIDGINWTERTGKGGSWCDNQLGKWIVVQSETTYRISEDTINWQEGLQFRLKNDPPVYSEVEEGSEEEPELLQPAGELYDLPFTIQTKSFSVFKNTAYTVGVVNNSVAIIYSSDLINWYMLTPENYNEYPSNYLGVNGVTNDIRTLSNIFIFNDLYVMFNHTLRAFIVTEDFSKFSVITPNNSNIYSWSYYFTNCSPTYRIQCASINGVVFISVINRSCITSGNSKSRLYVWYTTNMTDLSTPINNITTTPHNPINDLTLSNVLYNNGEIFIFNKSSLQVMGIPSIVSRYDFSGFVYDYTTYKGKIMTIRNGVVSIMNDYEFNDQENTPAANLISIASI